MRTMDPLYKLLVASFAVSVLAEGILMPIYAVFVQEIGGDVLDASGAIAIFLIVTGIMTILLHRFRWAEEHRMFMMVAGWAVWVLGIAGYMLVSNTASLFITQVVIALGNAIANPAFYAELDDHANQAYAWGIFEGMENIMGGVAAFAGGLIAVFFGFAVLVATMACVATLSLILILLYLRTKTRIRA